MNNGVKPFVTATNFGRSSRIRGPTLITPNIRNKETNARQLAAKRLKIILKTSQRPTIHVHFGRLIVLLCIRGQVNKPMTLRTLIENDVVITDKKELAELFNNYFVHIIDDVQDIKEHNFGHEFSAHPSIRAIAEENRRKNAIHNFNFKYTNKNQSEKLLLNINARKACGHDTITPRLLKESASVISGPLAELMNESIKQCKYPSRWKMGQVTPLFKKNDELSRENYRPVTV